MPAVSVVLGVMKDLVINVAAAPFQRPLERYLDSREARKEIEGALQQTEADFRQECSDPRLVQALVSKPIYDLPGFQEAAKAAFLDEAREEAIPDEFVRQMRRDWGERFSDDELRRAAGLYLSLLRQNLIATKNVGELVARFASLRTDQRTEEMQEDLRWIRKFLESHGFSVPETPSPRFSIPKPPQDFVGRDEELAQMLDRFDRGMVITGVTGAAGIGKTALVLVLAEKIASEFPDARLYIDLRGAAEQEPVSPQDAMRSLLRPFYPGQNLSDEERELSSLYRSTFQKRRSLLLLDNAADAAQVRPLLPSHPSAAIVTSRRRFDLSDKGLHMLPLGVMKPEEARNLLREVAPSWQGASDRELDEVAKLCGRLPLALRVAAALAEVNGWKPRHVARKLQHERTRLRRLKAPNDPDLDVEAAIGLSYENLPEGMQRRFRQLGVFPAPFEVKAAAAVWDENEEKADDILAALFSRNLVEYDGDGETERYSLHDLMRIFALGKLLEDVEEAKKAAERHAWHYLEVASEADDDFKKGDMSALERFDEAWPHLQAAWKWMLPGSGFPRPESADRWLSDMPRRVVYVLDLRVPPKERIPYLEAALEAAKGLGDKEAQGIHLGNLGNAYLALGRVEGAIGYYQQALEIHMEIGDRSGEGNDLGNLGNAYADLGRVKEAIGYYRQALEIAREIGDRRGEGAGLGNLGLAYADLGRVEEAIGYYQQALEIAREIGDRRGEGNQLGNLGLAYADLGRVGEAIGYYLQALEIAREIGDRRSEGAWLGNLGAAYHRLGRVEEAIGYYQQALEIAREIGDRRGEGNRLGNLGNAYADLGRVEEAIEYYQQALEIAREIGDRRGEGNRLGNLGNAYFALGRVEEAIEYYQQALEIAREIGDRRGEGNRLGNLGLAYADLGRVEEVIEYYRQALEIAREIGDRSGEGNRLGNLGNAYAALGRVEEAIGYYQQALEIAREIGDRRGEGNRLGNLGAAYHRLGRVEEAIGYYQQALEIHREIGDRRGEGADLGNLGLAYAALGRVEEAIGYYQQALEIAREIGDKRNEGNQLGNLGAAYIAWANWRKR